MAEAKLPEPPPIGVAGQHHVPTWLEYIRHNTRRTHADSANSEAIAALHIGPEWPRIHRMIERQTGSLPGLRLPSARTD